MDVLSCRCRQVPGLGLGRAECGCMDERSDYPEKLPTTVAEAVAWLEGVLPAAELSSIAALSEDELADLHFELGAYVRSRLGLWGANEALVRDCGTVCGAAASMAVIRALWEALRRRSEAGGGGAEADGGRL